MLTFHKMLIMHKKDNKENDAVQDKTVCFFRFRSLEDAPCAYEALCSKFIVFLDLSGMDEKEGIRLKDYMHGVSTTLHADIKEICEDYVAYFPSGYHLQEFEN